jgi:hypothetical protein
MTALESFDDAKFSFDHAAQPCGTAAGAFCLLLASLQSAQRRSPGTVA